ncbi:MAG: DUF4435 domain-containing protein [Muribaculaceae bacterium]|nr:DUF4435 domain-containing protein [Muribaculaceae bacterium]
MTSLTLPPLTDGRKTPELPDARQLSIIGGGGAGKTRFMEELTRLTGSRAYCLSALSAPFPEREESTRPGSIDMLFREAVEKQPYMRTDAVSELDKLTYMLFIDEFEYLLSMKQLRVTTGAPPRLQPTRLDCLVALWERVFPGNRIVRARGSMMFSTSSGGDLISVEKLSQSEQTVLYYAAAVLYAMPDAVIFIDSPSLFLHPTVLNNLWNSIEELRPDCTFVYNSVDVEFVNSRTHNVCVWVKSYDAEHHAWDYEVINPGDMREELFVDLIGTRKPVLFIEGDARHSIDARLYPLVFPDCTVKPLGSCDKVIESTRTFNDLRNMHHLASRGVVDRDRRTDPEVDYLRRKSVMVPDVAEVENLFLLEGVIRPMARRRRRNPDKVFSHVQREVENEFRRRFDEQALQHVRHRVKREVECKIDARFSCITAMEIHLKNLADMLRPRQRYNELREEFKGYLETHDYPGILKVFNHKPMLGDCGVARMLGYKNKDEYIGGVISALKEGGPDGEDIRECLRRCFRVGEPLPERAPRHRVAPRGNGYHARPVSPKNRRSPGHKVKKNKKRRRSDVK